MELITLRWHYMASSTILAQYYWIKLWRTPSRFHHCLPNLNLPRCQLFTVSMCKYTTLVSIIYVHQLKHLVSHFIVGIQQTLPNFFYGIFLFLLCHYHFGTQKEKFQTHFATTKNGISMSADKIHTHRNRKDINYDRALCPTYNYTKARRKCWNFCVLPFPLPGATKWNEKFTCLADNIHTNKTDTDRQRFVSFGNSRTYRGVEVVGMTRQALQSTVLATCDGWYLEIFLRVSMSSL